MDKFGIITLAFGPKRYIEQAEALSASLKMHMPGIPMAIVTDRSTTSPYFDYVVLLNAEHGLGTVQKIWLDQYSPFDETLYVDSDCLVTRPFHKELSEIRGFDFSPVVEQTLTRSDEDGFYFENLSAALTELNLDYFPKFNGGIYFFKKNAVSAAVFDSARGLVKAAKTLGLKSFDKGGPADETLIGLALAQNDIKRFYNDHGFLMRTPINLIGPLHIDVLGGGCSFSKSGRAVSPAICHFAAPYSQYWP